MCLLPGFKAITQAEDLHSRGLFDSARKQFLALTKGQPASIAARAAYRLAEIQETGSADGIQKARSAYLDVIGYGDKFWARRAAYRFLLLCHPSKGLQPAGLQPAALHPEAHTSIAPFSILFRQVIRNKSLETHMFAFEKERAMLEQSLITHLKHDESDAPLLAEILESQRNGMSLQVGETVVPPWDQADLSGVIVKQSDRYYVINKNTLSPLKRKDAVSGMRLALLKREDPLPFAFALALLVDEREPLPVEIISSSLSSSNEVILLSGLYAAQKAPSHALTQKLLSLWEHAAGTSQRERSLHRRRPWQSSLYEPQQRILLALASHFALGRESTQKILASGTLPEAEKAWLLQFRKDKNSTAYAQALLQHPNELVKMRTQNALRAWHS